jgi:hypothetical protein
MNRTDTINEEEEATSRDVVLDLTLIELRRIVNKFLKQEREIQRLLQCTKEENDANLVGCYPSFLRRVAILNINETIVIMSAFVVLSFTSMFLYLASVTFPAFFIVIVIAVFSTVMLVTLVERAMHIRSKIRDIRIGLLAPRYEFDPNLYVANANAKGILVSIEDV